MIAAVTGVHAGCQRSPGLAVGRSLRGCYDCDVIAIDYDNLSTGLRSPEFSHTEVVPWTDDPLLLAKRLLGVLLKCKADVILPCLNSDAMLIARLAGELSAVGIRSLLPSIGAFEMRSKPMLTELATMVGVLPPRTIVCRSEEDLAIARRELGLPLVLKGHECGVFPVRHEELFEYYAAYCACCFDFPILVQEWIEGEEYSVLGLCDRDSKPLQALVVKKIGIGDDGEGWMSTVVEAPVLIEVLQAVTTATGWIGPIECDLLINDRGHFLLDVNPRFPSWVDGPSSLGFNLPYQALRLAANLDPLELSPPASGTVFYKDVYDLCYRLELTPQTCGMTC